MQSFPRAIFGALGLSLLVAAGCQRLNMEKGFDLAPGDIKEPFIIEGPRSQQKIDVNVTSSAPVDVYVILSTEEPAVEAKLKAGQLPDPSKVLASERQVETATLSATIPAQNEYRIVLAGARKVAKVNVKVISR